MILRANLIYKFILIGYFDPNHNFGKHETISGKISIITTLLLIYTYFNPILPDFYTDYKICKD